MRHLFPPIWTSFLTKKTIQNSFISSPLFVSFSHECRTISLIHLSHQLGYIKVSELGYRAGDTALLPPAGSGLYGPNISNILTFHNPCLNTNIDLVFSSDDSALTPIHGFHSTPVMVAIGNGFAWCPYSELTSAKRGIVSRKKITPTVKACIDKYRNRGYDLQISPLSWSDHDCRTDPNCPMKIRTVLDDGNRSLFCFNCTLDQACTILRR